MKRTTSLLSPSMILKPSLLRLPLAVPAKAGLRIDTEIKFGQLDTNARMRGELAEDAAPVAVDTHAAPRDRVNHWAHRFHRAAQLCGTSAESASSIRETMMSMT